MPRSKIIKGLKEAVRHARKPPLQCCECGIKEGEWSNWAGGGYPQFYERRGKTYCDEHLLDTADKRAYERWYVDPNS
jgi:hypothetical protein